MALPEGYIPPNVKTNLLLGKRHAEIVEHNGCAKRIKSLDDDIFSNVLEFVGKTPLIRLDKIAKSEGLECDLLAKCEFLSASGSVKDRIGLMMVEDAEKRGLLKKGGTIIEPTSGNTGISLALVAAVKGYRCIIVMPERMSAEKATVLQALGAEVVRTPSAASYNSPESHFAVAWKLKTEIPDAVVLDQYRNPNNPLAHYVGTGTEILEQTGGNVDMVVCGTGTGGTLSGMGRKIKEVVPNCQMIGVDTYGSTMAQPDELNKTTMKNRHVEGIGHDFVPGVLDRSVVDKWYKASDEECFHYARRLIKEEGLLCGGSSGAAICAALKAAKNLKAGQKCVVILPDSIRNYLTKFVSDEWMEKEGFGTQPNGQQATEQPNGVIGSSAGAKMWWWDKPVKELNLNCNVSILASASCGDAVSAMKSSTSVQLAVVSNDRKVLGVVKLQELTKAMLTGKFSASDKVQVAMSDKFSKVSQTAGLKQVFDVVCNSDFAIVIDNSNGQFQGIVTATELVEYTTKAEK